MKKISPDSRVKFEFGRHETFALRESWLTKGLSFPFAVGRRVPA